MHIKWHQKGGTGRFQGMDGMEFLDGAWHKVKVLMTPVAGARSRQDRRRCRRGAGRTRATNLESAGCVAGDPKWNGRDVTTPATLPLLWDETAEVGLSRCSLSPMMRDRE